MNSLPSPNFSRTSNIYRHLTRLTSHTVFSAILITEIIFLITQTKFFDFPASYSSAIQLIRLPDQLYQIPAQIRYQYTYFHHLDFSEEYLYLPYLNLPVLLIFFLPLVHLPAMTAVLSYRFFNLGLLFLNLAYLYRQLPPRHRNSLLLKLSFTFMPIFSALFLSQTSLITLTLFTTIYHFLSRRHWFLSGLISSLLLYKPQMAVILFCYFLILRHKSLLLGLTIGSLTFGFLNLLLVPNLFSDYLNLIYFFAAHLSLSVNPGNMISWQGFFSQLQNFTGYPLSWKLPLATLASLITLVIVFFQLKSTTIFPARRLALIYSLIIVTTLITGLHIYLHEATLLLLPLFLCYPYFPASALRLAIIGWIIYFVVFLYIFALDNFHPIPLFPTLYLNILMIIILSKIRQPPIV